MFKPRKPAAGSGPRKGTHASAKTAETPSSKSRKPAAGNRNPAPAGAAAPRASRPASASRPSSGSRNESASPRPPRNGPRTESRSAARPAPKSAPALKPSLRAASAAASEPRPKPVQRRPRPSEAQGERLQKILAAAGIASRRACEAIILEGRVQVNGATVTELGTRADPHRDEITVDLQPIQREVKVHVLMNKPKGYVTTVKDDEGRPTVMALLHGISVRVYPVGRLDFNSEGLLLLTNDGDLAKRLTDPDSHIPKVYLVKVHRMPRPETLDEFREGFRLDGRRLKPCGIEIFEKADNPWLKVTLVEGKNQQIRRMFAAVGHPVSKLKRIAFGPLDDPALKPGEWRFLKPQELAVLKSL